MSRGMTVVEVLVIIAILFVLLSFIGFFFPFELGFYITCGWVLFLRRIGAEVEVDWVNVAFSVTMLVVFTVGMHSFLKWFYSAIANRERKHKSDEAAPGSSRAVFWRWRWSVSLVAIVVMMFVAGISITGIVHQFVWWAQSPVFATSSMRKTATRFHSLNNIKSMSLGVLDHVEVTGSLPAGCTMTDDGRLMHGWMALLLPHLEEQETFDAIDFDVPWDDPRNKAAYQSEIMEFLTSWAYRNGISEVDERGYSLSDYASNVRVVGGTRQLSEDDVSDGKSQTILMGEAFSKREPWGYPANWRDPSIGINKSERSFGAPWSVGGANFGMVDGSAQFISEKIDPEVLRALSTPAGSEAIDDSDQW